MIARIRAAFARARLRRHMYDRLIGGGTPDCPCGRCDADRAFLVRAGQPWDDPERAAWWRELERALGRVRAPQRIADLISEEGWGAPDRFGNEYQTVEIPTTLIEYDERGFSTIRDLPDGVSVFDKTNQWSPVGEALVCFTRRAKT